MAIDSNLSRVGWFSSRDSSRDSSGAGALAALAGAMLIGAAASAQPATSGRPSGDAPLAGPRVGEAARAASLVERDLEGRLRPLDAPPEEAAIERLTLTPVERERADAVIASRTAALDRVVLDNIPLLLRLDGANKADDARGQREALRELGEKLKGLNAEGPYKDRLGATLEPANAKAFHAMLEEYWRALVDEQGRGQGARAREKRAPAATRGQREAN